MFGKIRAACGGVYERGSAPYDGSIFCARKEMDERKRPGWRDTLLRFAPLPSIARQ